MITRVSRRLDLWVGLAALAGVIALAGCGGGSDKLSGREVATRIGADYCNDSGYVMKDRLDGSTQTIYECGTNSKVTCVTVEGGIVSDSTVVVRALFANELAGGRPSCVP